MIDASNPFIDSSDQQYQLRLSFRAIKSVLTWLLIWQGSQVGGSIFEFTSFINPLSMMAADELYLLVLCVVIMMERTVLRDYHVKRGYFDTPLLLIFAALFISWVRGSIVNQKFALVWEAHEAFVLPIAVFVIGNAFRETADRLLLMRLILLGILAKNADGVWIYFFSNDPAKTWGIIQMWRDGYLLGIAIVAGMLFAHLKPQSFRKLRSVYLWLFPIFVFVLLMSFRRTFIVGSLVSAFALLFTIGKERRKRHFWILIGVLFCLIVMVLVTDPTGILARLSGIIDPKEEGSAYIRLLEYPNVFQNILHNPIWGTPIATQWIQYYRMPLSAVYTTLGTHNTYLYFPLRTGIPGTIGFIWLLCRMWKGTLINWRLSKTEDDLFFSQMMIQMLIVYQTACMFGLMYGDAMSSLWGLTIVMFQLQNEHMSGIMSSSKISLLKTWKRKALVYKETPALLDRKPSRSIPIQVS